MGLVQDIGSTIEKSRKIIVFTGAGISTECGIPDFRGENGLYSMVKKQFKMNTPENIFDIDYFRSNPAPFYAISGDIGGDQIKPSFAHRYIAALESAGKISKIVTQNIDMLHEKAGSKNVTACHGSYKTAHCIKCGKLYSLPEYRENLRDGNVKYCECGGAVKPDIVFFGENLPEVFYSELSSPSECDLLLVIGTSLSVTPAAYYPMSVIKTRNPISIFINNDATQYDKYFTHVVHEDIGSFFVKLNESFRLIN